VTTRRADATSGRCTYDDGDGVSDVSSMGEDASHESIMQTSSLSSTVSNVVRSAMGGRRNRAASQTRCECCWQKLQRRELSSIAYADTAPSPEFIGAGRVVMGEGRKPETAVQGRSPPCGDRIDSKVDAPVRSLPFTFIRAGSGQNCGQNAFHSCGQSLWERADIAAGSSVGTLLLRAAAPMHSHATQEQEVK
jgi:hypothetical protein